MLAGATPVVTFPTATSVAVAFNTMADRIDALLDEVMFRVVGEVPFHSLQCCLQSQRIFVDDRFAGRRSDANADDAIL